VLAAATSLLLFLFCAPLGLVQPPGLWAVIGLNATPFFNDRRGPDDIDAPSLVFPGWAAIVYLWLGLEKISSFVVAGALRGLLSAVVFSANIQMRSN